MITVGIDSYVTVDQADTYIRSHYTASSPEYIRWYKLNDHDRAVYLKEAFAEIDTLPFPRRFGDVPDAVMWAQCELAVWLSDADKRNGEDSRRELIKQGVTAFSLGDLSESYGGTSDDSGTSPALDCDKCRRLLRPWLSGGFKIC